MSQSGMTTDSSTPVLRFSVALEPSHLLRARERLRDYLRLYCADEELVDDVVLCVEEACHQRHPPQRRHAKTCRSRCASRATSCVVRSATTAGASTQGFDPG